MAMRETDRLLAVPRGTVQDVITFFTRRKTVKRWANFIEYVEEVFATAPRVGLDPSIVIAQASHETEYFTSYWWNARLNPAGLGITGDPYENSISRTFRNGKDSARAQMTHLMLYATGKVTYPLMPSDDPRYDAYIKAYGAVSKTSTIVGLSRSWATDPIYSVGIVRHGNEIFRNLPDSRQSTVPVVSVAKGASPLVIRGITWNGMEDADLNGVTLHADRRTVTVNVNALNVRTYATSDNRYSKVLYTLGYNAKVAVLGWVSGESVGGENRWWVGADHSRIWVGGTSEKPR